MISKKMKILKKNSILINTSRGELLDEKMLYRLLKSKKIKGAGIDVFYKEPYDGELIKLDNIVLTPHIGSYAMEIRNQMEIESVENIIKGIYEE